MLFKKMAPFKHNKTDALLGWFHTFVGQCIVSQYIGMGISVATNLKLRIFLES